MSDSDRVQQILANLLSNAIKFSPRGTAVDVRLTTTKRTARVTVRDHGPGVPKGSRDQLFSRFWQGQQPNPDRRVRGSGLGLSISRALASALGGEVGYEEPAGGGACFWVTFNLDGVRA
jgi:signal transduction histidine kinase